MHYNIVLLHFKQYCTGVYTVAFTMLYYLDEMGLDKMEIDEMGVDKMGGNQCLVKVIKGNQKINVRQHCNLQFNISSRTRSYCWLLIPGSQSSRTCRDKS